MAADEGWAIQVNIKHGPNDDRGNPLYMTNVRGYTAGEVAGQLQTLAEESARINNAINQFVGVSTVAQWFEVERAPQPNEPAPQYQPEPVPVNLRPEQMAVGQTIPCPVNPRGAVHERRTGAKKQGGGNWNAVFCNNKPTECAAVWL